MADFKSIPDSPDSFDETLFSLPTESPHLSYEHRKLHATIETVKRHARTSYYDDRKPKILQLTWIRDFAQHPWFIEIISLVLAWISFAAIVLTLAIHQDQPLPQWPRLISINSLIAVFTAILKTSLIMPVAEGLGQLKWEWFRQTKALIDLNRLDAATRGPWGSLRLLGTHFKSQLICLGAIITIAALAIDPLSQQVIQYSYCPWVRTGDTATISTASSYVVSNDDDTIDKKLVNAIYSGIIQPPANASAPIAFHCPTGNCTFPESNGATHMSLAVCGECHDNTYAITTFNNQTNTTYHFLNTSLLSDDGWRSKKKQLYLSKTVNDYTDKNKLNPEIQQWLSASSYIPSSDSKASPYIIAFDVIMYAGCDCTTFNHTYSNCTCQPFAATCNLSPCIKTYRAEIKNFVLNETTIPTEMSEQNRVNKEGFMWVGNKTILDGNWQDCNSQSKMSPEFPVGLFEGYQLPDGSGIAKAQYRYYPEGCIWDFDEESTSTMKMHLHDLWSGSLKKQPLTNSPKRVYGNISLTAMFREGNASLATLEDYVDGLANSITSVVRDYGTSTPNAGATGLVYSSQTCIRVRWAWLGIPVVLLTFTVIFLTKVIWNTRGRDGGLWKSSPLALLFHGFEADVSERFNFLTQPEMMLDTARLTDVKLEQDSVGWRFVLK